MKIEELSLEERIGQMFIVGMNTSNIIDKIDDLILKYKIGGILLYKKNYKNCDELIEIINYIKKLNKANKIPILIAIDQEGGRVNRMPEDFKNIPAAYKLASNSQEENLVKQAGEITAQMLAKIGVNMDLAPVLDIKRFENQHAIGDRAFSEKKEEVYKYGITYMKELQKQNIISVIKHFPGHGATATDSHFMLPIIKTKMEELEKEDMIPFGETIKNGADAMLVSHLRIKGITQKFPSTMSRKFITKYIGKKYHYKGVIIADDMRMKGVQFLYGKDKPVKRAFEAGNDIILMKYMDGDNIIEQIIEEVKQSSIKQARVNRSVKRILALKEKYNIEDKEVQVDKKWIEETNKKIQEIRDKVQKNV